MDVDVVCCSSQFDELRGSARYSKAGRVQENIFEHVEACPTYQSAAGSSGFEVSNLEGSSQQEVEDADRQWHTASSQEEEEEQVNRMARIPIQFKAAARAFCTQRDLACSDCLSTGV
jgi:hypothetical protein